MAKTMTYPSSERTLDLLRRAMALYDTPEDSIDVAISYIDGIKARYSQELSNAHAKPEKLRKSAGD